MASIPLKPPARLPEAFSSTSAAANPSVSYRLHTPSDMNFSMIRFFSAFALSRFRKARAAGILTNRLIIETTAIVRVHQISAH